jgi:hypothetical protein
LSNVTPQPLYSQQEKPSIPFEKRGKVGPKKGSECCGEEKDFICQEISNLEIIRFSTIILIHEII